MTEERRPTTVRIRVSALEWLKVEAVRRRKSVTEIVEELIEAERGRAT